MSPEIVEYINSNICWQCEGTGLDGELDFFKLCNRCGGSGIKTREFSLHPENNNVSSVNLKRGQQVGLLRRKVGIYE